MEAYNPSTSELPSLVLVCPSNCGLGTLTLNDRGQAFAHIIAGYRNIVLKRFLSLAYWFMARVNRRFKTGQMRPALDGIDIIGKRKNGLGITVVILQGHFHNNIILCFFEIYYFVVQRVFVLIKIFDE